MWEPVLQQPASMVFHLILPSFIFDVSIEEDCEFYFNIEVGKEEHCKNTKILLGVAEAEGG